MRDIPIAIWAPPYAGLASYIYNESGRGYNSDGSRTANNAAQDLITLVLGNDAHNVFEDKIASAKLISNDLTFVVPEPLDSSLRSSMAWELAIDFDSKFSELEASRQAVALANEDELFMLFWGRVNNHDSQERFARMRQPEKEELCWDMVRIAQQFYCLGELRKLRGSHLVLSRNSFHGVFATPTSNEYCEANILGVLAASGISIALPYIGDQDHDVLEEVRERFRPQLDAYLASLSELTVTAYEGIQSGKYASVEQFASIHVNSKLRPAIAELNRAIEASRIKSLKTIANLISTNTADLMSSIVLGNVPGAIAKVLEMISKGVLQLSPDASLACRHPLAAYVYAIRKDI